LAEGKRGRSHWYDYTRVENRKFSTDVFLIKCVAKKKTVFFAMHFIKKRCLFFYSFDLIYQIKDLMSKAKLLTAFSEAESNSKEDRLQLC